MKVVSDLFRLWLSLRPAQRVWGYEKFLSFGFYPWLFYYDLVQHGTLGMDVFRLVVAVHAASLAGCAVPLVLVKQRLPRFPGGWKKLCFVQWIEILIVSALLSLLLQGSGALLGSGIQWMDAWMRLLATYFLAWSVLTCWLWAVMDARFWMRFSKNENNASWFQLGALLLLPFLLLVVFLCDLNRDWLVPGLLAMAITVLRGNRFFHIYTILNTTGEQVEKTVLNADDCLCSLWIRIWGKDSLFPYGGYTGGIGAAFSVFLMLGVLGGLIGAGLFYLALVTFGLEKPPDEFLRFIIPFIVGFLILTFAENKQPREITFPGLMGRTRAMWAEGYLRYRMVVLMIAAGYFLFGFVLLPWLLDLGFGLGYIWVDRPGITIPWILYFVALAGLGRVVSQHSVSNPLRLRTIELGYLSSFRFRFGVRALPASVLFISTLIGGFVLHKQQSGRDLFDPATWNGLAVPLFVLALLLLAIASWVWSFRLQYRAILKRDLV
jgi:hypothetical protein